MNLAIDLGNTQAKIGVFDHKQLVEAKQSRGHNVNNLLSQISNVRFPVSGVILSSVIHHPKRLEVFLKKNFSLLVLTHRTPLPIKNKYKTPHTLGKDRIAAAAGANSFFPRQHLLVIDAGTCITYDFVNKKGEYRGGSISPGIDMRFRALHTFTHRLPLIKKEKLKNLTGQSTKESMLTGVQVGVVAEMDGMIDLYKRKYGNLQVVITGGDAGFFETRLKNKIFAFPNLVLYGLNTILEYNSP